MAARRGKSQARRNGSNGLPGWAWLVIGVLVTLLVVLLAPRLLKDGDFNITPEGRARVVLHPGDPCALEPGDVLIAPITDPAWTPLFVPAVAVVVNVGAVVSHAIIVSRELGIPCVVSVTDATKRIPDGALVRVDGSTGTVTVLEG